MLVQCEWAAKRQRNSYYLGEFHRLHKATVGSAASAASSSTSAAEQTTLIGMPAPPTVAEHLPGSPHKELAGARLQGGSYQSDASDQRSSIDRASEPMLPHVAIRGAVVPCSRCLNAGEFSDHRAFGPRPFQIFVRSVGRQYFHVVPRKGRPNLAPVQRQLLCIECLLASKDVSVAASAGWI
jgi:hypothetical protein